VGLQLAALSLQGRDDVGQFVRAFAGSNRYVLDYLVDEVFARQPAVVQDFLLKTSVLDRLTGDLCDAVAEREDSRELLLSLERTNLFVVPLDDRREWYRYHHLFRDLLQTQSQGTDPASLHRRAARWYEDQGYLDEAMAHTLAIEDWDGAERLMEAAAIQAIDNGQWVTLSRWLEVFPDARVRQDASLATFQAWALFSTGQFEAAAGYAGLAEKLLPAGADPFDRAMIVCLQAFVAQMQADVPQAMELAHEALELLGQEGPVLLRSAALGVLSGAQEMMGDLAGAIRTMKALARLGREADHPISAAGALTDLAWLLHLQGDPAQALALCRQALDHCLDGRGHPLPLAMGPHVILGRIYVHQNDLERARQHLAAALELCEQGGPMGGRLATLVEWARLQQAMGEEAAARTTLDDVRQLVALFALAQVEQMAAHVEAEIQLEQGQIAAVERWAAEAGLSPTDAPSHLREPEVLTYARLLLAQQRWDQAQTLLANCESFARERGRHRSLIAVRVLQALVHQGLGRRTQALDCLQEALRLAAPGEYRRAFLDGGRPVLDLLPQVRHVAPAFVDSLLAASTTSPASPSPDSRPQADANRALIEPLSERELEVLGLVVAGMTNREIAEALFISVGTVKTHTHHIYGKLGVNARPRAIARALELDLVQL
jgi:LuxR family maltose regulon positive regulatory protein